jgi:hypothetical protein
MGHPRGPTEGGSGGKRGHSNMEHWGYTAEVKRTARMRRRLNDKQMVTEQVMDHEPSMSDSPCGGSITHRGIVYRQDATL